MSVYPPVFVSGGHVTPLDVVPDERETATRQALLDDVLRAVETGQPPCASAEDGITLMRIVDAVERSAIERREVLVAGRVSTP
ncbi:MAG: hypothetical protein H0V67_07100 [Geodermatophilaceae bacterium]|nr:hypothetical protein [Geodermatophilaceae bacterium]